jgi:hypothetical protein
MQLFRKGNCIKFLLLPRKLHVASYNFLEKGIVLNSYFYHEKLHVASIQLFTKGNCIKFLLLPQKLHVAVYYYSTKAPSGSCLFLTAALAANHQPSTLFLSLLAVRPSQKKRHCLLFGCLLGLLATI